MRLRATRAQRVLGITLRANEIASILSRLGMTFGHKGDEFSVTPPSYRFDIAIEEDLIEELARVHGYDNIPPSKVRADAIMQPQPEARRHSIKLRNIMSLRDYVEVINYAFVEEKWERELHGSDTLIPLQNPIASQMSVMRSSLLGGLLSTLCANLARRQSRIRLFEVGACFGRVAESYVQSEHLGAVIYGAAQAEQWGTPTRNVDFFDAKADVEALFAPLQPVFVAAEHPASHPGRSAQILLDGKVVGWLGELHPEWQQCHDLPLPVIWFELELDALTHVALPAASEPSRFPPVRRDLAVLVDERVTAQSLIDAMLAIQAPFVSELALFDVYRGKGVEIGKKSLAFKVLLQDTKKTLTDAEIDQTVACLLKELEKCGAQLRV